MYKVLLIEDSDSIREAVESYLILNDYSVTSCRNLQEAKSALTLDLPGLAIVDVNLPDGNGFLFARKVLSGTKVPFLFMTSRNEESDRITGLELGASDYIVKPFSLKEMMLRIEAIKRRTVKPIPGQKVENNSWKLNDSFLEIDQKSHRVTLDDKALKLTPTEWEILSKLISNNGAILSREQIQKSLWNLSDEKSLKTVDSHIKNIRSKLKSPHWIEAVRGFGFRFTGVN